MLKFCEVREAMLKLCVIQNKKKWSRAITDIFKKKKIIVDILEIVKHGKLL